MTAKIMNRDVIKYFAMAAMLLNHIGNIFLEPGTALSAFFIDIGYFTAPVMCYFLVEGYQYTRSKKKYAFRLALFAVLSEIPFCLAFSELYNGEKVISFCGFNMIFTLLLCFGILYVMEHVRYGAVRTLLIIGLFLASCFSDWALLAPMFTVLFAQWMGNERKIRNAFLLGAGLFALMNFQPAYSMEQLLVNFVYAVLSASGILLAGAVIVCFYNGKRMEKGKKFSQWFFYLFYPAHLLILGMIRIFT